MSAFTIAFLTASFIASSCSSPSVNAGHDIVHVIPLPASIKTGTGQFILNAETVLVVDLTSDAAIQMAAFAWAEAVRNATGFPLPIVDFSDHQGGDNTISLSIEDKASDVPEGYRLAVTKTTIQITSPAANGLYYGLQTLRQLLPAQIEQTRGSPGDALWSVPVVEINDQPRFTYRGMHLDVGRHFFGVEFIKRYIDLISRYKMNYFHWHLTDDQGWRIEIKKYPLLTEIGSRRKETILEKNFSPYVGDGIPHEGFYTQEEIREIVVYAEMRFVTIIPEIEMPGHSGAAIAAYPELACTEGPFEVSTTWGVNEDILCPSEQTFAFLADVLSEVISLFPSPYIHIGADEVPVIRWQESALAQQVMRDNFLQDESKMRGWFIRRIESFLRSRNKKLIGWDDILHGGLAPEATVMSWRGMERGIEAAKMGHDVIMTPTKYAYFDYYQGEQKGEPLAIGGFLPLDSVYAFEPVPAELNAEEAAHIIGAQGNVWTEYIKTNDHVEYMAFPRALAMAEVVWSPKKSRDFDSFSLRLSANLKHLRALGVNFRLPHEIWPGDTLTGFIQTAQTKVDTPRRGDL